MLITTINEIKQVLPKLVSNLNATSLLPNFDTAEAKYLLPLTGNELYEDIVSKYKTDTLSPGDQQLLKHMRLVVAAYAFLDEQAATHVFFTDDGIRVAGTNDMQKAVGWEYKELKSYLRDRALDGTEVLLTYLWQQKDSLPMWTTSSAYTQFNRLLLKTGSEFDEMYRLYQPMRTFYALKTLMADVQEEYISSPLGASLMTYLKDLDQPEGNLGQAVYKLKKALAFFTIRRAVEHFPVRFSESGFTVISEYGGDREGDDSGRAAASLELMRIKMQACDREGKNFMARAKNELVKLRKAGDQPDTFNEAFDKGPLTRYVDPAEQVSGNERRKSFRF